MLITYYYKIERNKNYIAKNLPSFSYYMMSVEFFLLTSSNLKLIISLKYLLFNYKHIFINIYKCRSKIV